MMKLCFAASSGGHLEEISRLEKLRKNRESFLFTEEGSGESSFCDRVYYVKKIDRKERFFFLHFAALFRQSWRVLRMERPDCIITTGALCAYPISLLGKLRRCKLIYIESFARTSSASLTGKLMYRIADLFIVQWEEGLSFFPKAVYGGGLL